MEDNDSRSFYLRTYLYKCFYVYPTFYKFTGKGKVLITFMQKLKVLKLFLFIKNV